MKKAGMSRCYRRRAAAFIRLFGRSCADHASGTKRPSKRWIRLGGGRGTFCCFGDGETHWRTPRFHCATATVSHTLTMNFTPSFFVSSSWYRACKGSQTGRPRFSHPVPLALTGEGGLPLAPTNGKPKPRPA